MANMDTASQDFQFGLKFGELQKELREFLTTAGMHKALIYANFFVSKESSSAALVEARERLSRRASACRGTTAMSAEMPVINFHAFTRKTLRRRNPLWRCSTRPY